ncbi:MAG: sugar phosphate isomerase/epimerase family protein [Chloroflexota bacterium]|jgi:sugar phosphate isomerase/epimerase
MKDSWRKHLKLGVIQGMMFPDAGGNSSRTVETARQILQDDLFGVLVVGRMDDDTMKAVKAMAADAHVAIGISAAPVVLGGKLNLASLDEGVRVAAVDALKKSIDDAYFLGAPIVEVLDGAGNYPGPELEEKAADQITRSLVELCRYAENKATGASVWVLLETFDRAVDKRSVLGPSDLAVKVAAKVRAEQANFGLTIDMGHLPLIGEGYKEALRTTSEYLVHVHLGSCIKDDPKHPAYGDSHPAFGVQGGVADVAELVEFLTALQEIGYFEKKGLPTGMPWMTFEVKPQPGQSPELLLANCRRVFKEAWARL